MNYEDLLEANKILSTIPIKGKEYVMVNERVMAFRKLFPMGSITTEIKSLSSGFVVIKATITDELQNVLSTGTAYEREERSSINQTSFIENCETSAVGRALAFLGIGIDASMASAEEVANAIVQHADLKTPDELATDKQKNLIKTLCNEKGIVYESALQKCKLTDETLTKAMASRIIKQLQERE